MCIACGCEAPVTEDGTKDDQEITVVADETEETAVA